ncbi:MAG: hypothetical protein IJ869_07380 [Clostridiales bacterium]|nr:hypothetical protein [Clostridiales bacterium]
MKCPVCGTDSGTGDKCSNCGLRAPEAHWFLNYSTLSMWNNEYSLLENGTSSSQIYVDGLFFGFDCSLLGSSYDQLHEIVGNALSQMHDYTTSDEFDRQASITIDKRIYKVYFRNNALAAIRYEFPYDVGKHTSIIKMYDDRFKSVCPDGKDNTYFRKDNLFSDRSWDLNSSGISGYVAVFRELVDGNPVTAIQYQSKITSSWIKNDRSTTGEIPLTECKYSYRKNITIATNHKTGRIQIIEEHGFFELKSGNLILYTRDPLGRLFKQTSNYSGLKVKLALANQLLKYQFFSATNESVVLFDLKNGYKLAIVSSKENIEKIGQWADGSIMVNNVMERLFKK